MNQNKRIVLKDSLTNKDVLLMGTHDWKRGSRNRLEIFCRWLEQTGRPWHQPDLETWRDHLLTYLAPVSVRAYLGTVKSQYRNLLRSNDFLALLYRMVDHDRPDLSPADRKALVDLFMVRLQNETYERSAPVKVVRVQDEADGDHIRLTVRQARKLLRQPGTDTVRGLRDTAIIAVMLATGIREGELCALKVEDLRQFYDGQLALAVRDGKGHKQRMVPYGGMAWVLDVVDAWLDNAGVSSGPVFRGFYKGGSVRSVAMTPRTVQLIIEKYRITVAGVKLAITPHDLRRTYARNMYVSGMSIEAIRQNMGHSMSSTTMRYIGNLAGETRAPGSVFTFEQGE